MSPKTDVEKLQYIKKIRHENRKLADRIPKRINEKEISSKSRIPFKIKSLEFILAKRVNEISRSALSVFEISPLSFLILTRSISESSSILFWLSQKVINSIQIQSIELIDKFVLRIMFGSKTIDSDPPPYNPYNVLKAVDKVDKKYKGFRKNYDILCDFTHPNYSGAFQSFGKLESDKGILNIVNSSNKISLGLDTHILVISLANYSMDQIENNFDSFVTSCELKC